MKDKTSEQIIQVENLTKKFGDFTAVNDVSFNVKKGEIFAFLGPNGAGKSTTIKMLTTLLASTSGKILIDGVSPIDNQTAARKAFGIVFQDPSLDDDLTAMENMELHAALYAVPVKEVAKRIQTLMEFVDLWDRRNSMVKTFSGGMKRRLEIARGLLHHPKILFLDEPTIGLDPQTRNHMWTYLHNANKQEGMTVFFTTHYMDEAEKNADRVVVIDSGKVMAEGTPAQLMTKYKAKSLEDAFLAITGKEIRNEEVSGADNFKNHAKMWRRGR